MFVVVDNLPASHPWPMEICIKLIFRCYLLLELVTISSGKFYKWSLSHPPIWERAPTALLVEFLSPSHLVREHPRPHQYISGDSSFFTSPVKFSLSASIAGTAFSFTEAHSSLTTVAGGTDSYWWLSSLTTAGGKGSYW